MNAFKADLDSATCNSTASSQTAAMDTDMSSLYAPCSSLFGNARDEKGIGIHIVEKTNVLDRLSSCRKDRVMPLSSLNVAENQTDSAAIQQLFPGHHHHGSGKEASQDFAVNCRYGSECEAVSSFASGMLPVTVRETETSAREHKHNSNSATPLYSASVSARVVSNNSTSASRGISPTSYTSRRDSCQSSVTGSGCNTLLSPAHSKRNRRNHASASGRSGCGPNVNTQATMMKEPGNNCTPVSASVSSTPVPEQDKRMRREIANSNERRRMQCINNGFLSLQAILPKTYLKRGEKMSKAAILQSTVEYISKLEEENRHLQQQTETLEEKLVQKQNSVNRLDNDSSDEGISVVEEGEDGRRNPVKKMSQTQNMLHVINEMQEKYEKERSLRNQAQHDLQQLLQEMEFCGRHMAVLPSGKSSLEYNVSAPADRNRSKEQASSDFRNGPIIKIDNSSQFPELPCESSVSPVREAPHSFTGFDKHNRNTKRTGSSSLRCPCGASSCNLLFAQEEREVNGEKKPLSGFDLLFEAITYSEREQYSCSCSWECDRSDSGCSEETLASSSTTFPLPSCSASKCPINAGSTRNFVQCYFQLVFCGCYFVKVPIFYVDRSGNIYQDNVFLCSRQQIFLNLTSATCHMSPYRWRLRNR